MAELALGQEETRQRLIAIAIGAVAIIAIVYLAVAIAQRDILKVTMVSAVVGFVVVFPFPKLAIVIVILFSQIQYLFTTYSSLVGYPIFPRGFQLVDEVILLALLGNLLLTKLLRKEGLEKVPGLVMVAALFVVGLASARLNGVGLGKSLYGQRYVFEMVILYLALTNLNLGERFLRNLVYLLLGIGFFQAMIGLLEFAAKFRLYLTGNHDIVQGTWGEGSSNRIGIFFLCLSAIALARLRRRWHGPSAILVGTYVVLVVLSSCRTGIVLAPLIVLFVLREKFKDPKYWIAAITVLVFLAGALVLYYGNSDADLAKDLGGDEFVFQVMGRTGVVPTMAHVLRENSKFPPFGSGPSTYVPSSGEIFGSELYLQVESMARTRQVVVPFISASYAVVWMEYGIVGLLLFAMILLRFFLYAWQNEKQVSLFFWKDYFRALQAIILIYALAGGIFAMWTHFQASIYLWLFPAIGVRYAILEKEGAARATVIPAAEQDLALPPHLSPGRVGPMTS